MSISRACPTIRQDYEREIHKAAKAKIVFPRCFEAEESQLRKEPESKVPRKKAHGMIARERKLSATSDSDNTDSSDGDASTEETDEAVFLSTELFSKATPSPGLPTAGASSHMFTNPISLEN